MAINKNTSGSRAASRSWSAANNKKSSQLSQAAQQQAANLGRDFATNYPASHNPAQHHESEQIFLDGKSVSNMPKS